MNNQNIRNMLSGVIGWSWPVLLAFAVTPYLLEGLGEEGFGIRSILIMLVGYFSMLNFGISGAVTKYMSEYVKIDNNYVKDVLSTSFLIHLILGLVGGLALSLISEYLVNEVFHISAELENEAIIALRISAFSFIFTMMNSWAGAIVSGDHRYDILNYMMSLYGTLTLVSSLILVEVGYGVTGVAIANLIASICLLLVYIYIFKQLDYFINLEIKFKIPVATRLLKFGSHFFIFQIFGMLFSQLDRFLIGVYLGVTILTYYVIPHQVAIVVHQLTSKVMQFLFPLVSSTKNNDINKLRRICVRGTTIGLFLSLSLAIPIIIYGDKILLFWMNNEISEYSSDILLVLTFTYVLMSITAVSSSIFSGMGYPYVVSSGSVITGTIASFLYFSFIEHYELFGIAIAGLVSVFATIVYYLFMLNKYLPNSVSMLIKDSWIAVVLFLIVIGIFKGLSERYHFFPESLLQVVFYGGFCSLTYGVLCWFTNVIKKDEKRQIINFARSITIK
jgi:O-antigen/teichoic acid export membrane protein